MLFFFFLGYVPYPKTLSLSFMFICFSCTRVLLSLLSSRLYFHDRAERRPSRVNFIWTSQWICVHVRLNHSDVCFHLKSVSLSFHFRPRVRFWTSQGLKKTFYRSRSRSSLDFGLICSLIGQLHTSRVAQTHTCWRGTFVKFAAPPVCLNLWILMSSASSVYT